MTELRRAQPRGLDCSDAAGGAELVRERFVRLRMPVKSPGYDSDRYTQFGRGTQALNRAEFSWIRDPALVVDLRPLFSCI